MRYKLPANTTRMLWATILNTKSQNCDQNGTMHVVGSLQPVHAHVYEVHVRKYCHGSSCNPIKSPRQKLATKNQYHTHWGQLALVRRHIEMQDWTRAVSWQRENQGRNIILDSSKNTSGSNTCGWLPTNREALVQC